MPLSLCGNLGTATLHSVMNHIEPVEPAHPYAFLCPQCGCPTHGSMTRNGERLSLCEDCTSDRDIDDAPLAVAD